jgi:2-dehydro-3-deoxyphosphogluconate aldolase/(4S)-4-hydroxy-2-oxoglutarate aldolase
MANEKNDAPLTFELGHVGINCENPEQANEVVNLFCAMFGYPKNDGPTWFFAGGEIEVLKTPFKGTHGHIGIRTNDVGRALAQLESAGYVFDKDSIKQNSQGKISSAYLKDEIGGFAVHLTARPK